LDSLINECYDNGKPTYYRLSEHENDFSNDVKVGRANLIKKGNDATIICFGNSLNSVIESTKNMDVTILYYTSVRPFDGDLLLANFNQNIIIVEPFYEGSVNFEVTKTLKDKKYSLYNIGVPREFIMKYGKKEEVDKFVGLDQKSINENINKILCQI
jgi:transketolase